MHEYQIFLGDEFGVFAASVECGLLETKQRLVSANIYSLALPLWTLAGRTTHHDAVAHHPYPRILRFRQGCDHCVTTNITMATIDAKAQTNSPKTSL